MTNLGKQLRDGDPLADAPSLLPRDVQRIRQAVIAEVGRPSALWWPRPAVVVATVAATLAVGVAIRRSLPHDGLFSSGVVERRRHRLSRGRCSSPRQAGRESSGSSIRTSTCETES